MITKSLCGVSGASGAGAMAVVASRRTRGSSGSRASGSISIRTQAAVLVILTEVEKCGDGLASSRYRDVLAHAATNKSSSAMPTAGAGRDVRLR